MQAPLENPVVSLEAPPLWYLSALGLLGNKVKLPAASFSRIHVHDTVARGLPGEVLTHLLQSLKTLSQEEVLAAVGVSGRTLQRRRLAPKRPLGPDLSGRTWRFVHILASATVVFGDQADAEQWLISPAIALDRRRPIDLLSSSVGADLVEELLGRLETGVYT